ncbi:MAG: Fic family protein [Mycobacteriales bacterium]
MNVGLVLHLHRLLLGHTAAAPAAGVLKPADNLVVDENADGSRTVRFTPVPASRTPYFLDELPDRYAEQVRQDVPHPVLLVGLVVLDLLVVHPFEDGNGRVARVLTTALLSQGGYTVGRYVSLEQRAASTRAVGSKRDRVKDHVLRHAPVQFRISDLRSALPGSATARSPTRWTTCDARDAWTWTAAAAGQPGRATDAPRSGWARTWDEVRQCGSDRHTTRPGVQGPRSAPTG